MGYLIKVVRCKDCKHYIDTETGWCDIHSHFNQAMTDWTMFDEKDYCSSGELGTSQRKGKDRPSALNSPKTKTYGQRERPSYTTAVPPKKD